MAFAAERLSATTGEVGLGFLGDLTDELVSGFDARLFSRVRVLTRLSQWMVLIGVSIEVRA